MQTLKIVIKKIYFDQIASGENKIEYCGVKPIWQSRFYDANCKKEIMTTLNLFMATMLMLSE